MRNQKTALQTILQALLVPSLVLLALAIASQALAQAQTTVAGSTPGQFAVSPSGAATYRIPIQVPPGVAGMAPKLELVYNSQSGNGMLGVGWGLSGLSSITRCPRTKVSDGVIGGVNFDANDRFCLDGQRLIMTTGTVYGAPGTEYRTELESFSKITANGTAGNGPASFTVKTKSGLTMEFGGTADSAIEAIKAPGNAATWPATTIKVWAQNKVSDVKGNYYTVSYTEDAANGDFYPSRMDYTGNGSAGLAPANSVRFLYETRPDLSSIKYHAGSLSKNLVRLSKVQAYQGVNLLKDYRLAYEVSTSTKFSRLITLTECDGAATPNCLPAITLAWQNAGLGFATSGQAVFEWNGGPFSGHKFQFVDLNGDGRPDLVITRAESGAGLVQYRLANATGFDPLQTVIDWGGPYNYSGYRYQFADMNGDGLLDLMITRADNGRAEFGYMLGTGNGFGAYRSVFEWNGYDFSSYSFQFPDLNGDGKADLVITRSGVGAGSVQYQLSNGSGFDSIQTVIDWVGPYDFRGYSFQFADTNGDGILDLMISRAESGRAEFGYMLGTGSGFGAYRGVFEWNGPYNFSRYWFQFPDLNGDGKADLVITRSDSGAGSVQYQLSNGTGFEPMKTVIDWGGPYNYSSYRFQFADVNSDGIPDLMITRAESGRAEFSYMLGTGIGASAGSGFGPLVNVFTWDGPYNFSGYTFQFADLNGDGKADLSLLRADSGRASFDYQLGLTPALEQPLYIANGLGAVTSFTQTPLTNATTYTKDSGANKAVLPKVDVQIPMYVVSSVATSNGVGGTNTTNYTYGGLKAEVGTGRGMLGFRWTKSQEVATGLENYTEYRQDFPYTGMPLLSETRLAGKGNAGILKRNTNTVECKIPQTASACTIAPGNRYFPVVTTATEASWDLNAAAFPVITTTTSYVADANGQLYGDVGTITVGTNDGAYKQTVNTYFPADTTNWILGRLKSATVTSVKP